MSRLCQIAPLATPNRITQDEEGDDGQRHDPVDADVEGESVIERLEAHRPSLQKELAKL